MILLKYYYYANNELRLFFVKNSYDYFNISIFYVIFLSLSDIFFCFSCFPSISMDILNIVIATKKMRLNDIRNVIFENYYKGIGFS